MRGALSGYRTASDDNSSFVHAANAAAPDAPAPPRRSERVAAPIERFSASKYSAWSAYDMDRQGERHDHVWDDVEEAVKAEKGWMRSSLAFTVLPRSQKAGRRRPCSDLTSLKTR